MQNHIKPPRLSTSFSRSGAKARDRFANILDTRSKKRGIIAAALVIASLFTAGGCFKKKASAPAPTDAAVTAANGMTVAAIGKDSSGQRNDIILLAHMSDGALTVTQIPRDTVAGYNGSAKIEQMPEPHQILPAIEEVTGVKCDKYVIVNYGGFREIVNAVGGIDFNVPVDMRYSDPSQGLEIDLRAGEQHLDGGQVEELIRYRKSNVTGDGTFNGYENGDLDRLAVQSGVYKAIGEKLRSFDAAAKLPEILKNNTETNLTTADFAKILAEAIKLKPENIKIETLPGEYNDNGEYICEKRKAAEATGLPSIYGEDDTVGYTAKITSARVNGTDYKITDEDYSTVVYDPRLKKYNVSVYGGTKDGYIAAAGEVSGAPAQSIDVKMIQDGEPVLNIPAFVSAIDTDGGEFSIVDSNSDTKIIITPTRR